MKLSSRTEYAVRAMAELAQMHGGDPVSLREIAGRQEIPEKYLEQLFRQLRKAGLIKGVRGAQGGYTLTGGPRDVTVGDIMRAVDGPIAVCSCASEGQGQGDCERKPHCAAHPVWARLQNGIVSILDSTTLYDMLAQTPASDMQGNRGGGS
jgi:Rrf2 family protein